VGGLPEEIGSPGRAQKRNPKPRKLIERVEAPNDFWLDVGRDSVVCRKQEVGHENTRDDQNPGEAVSRPRRFGLFVAGYGTLLATQVNCHRRMFSC